MKENTKNNTIKIAIALMAGLMLAGCVSDAPAPEERDKSEIIEAEEIAQYSNLQLCREADSLQQSLNVNPASHPEYNRNWHRSKALQRAIATRKVNCYKLKSEKDKLTHPLSPRQKLARVSFVCHYYAQNSQFADPNVLLAMCAQGYQSTPEKCTRDAVIFDKESQKLTGVARAEFIEIGVAFSMGCNQK